MLRFFSSVPLAVVLISALAGLSVASTLYDMPEIFQSWPFRLLALAFFINLLLCSVQLWPGLYRRLTQKAAPSSSERWALARIQPEPFQEFLEEQGYRLDVYEDDSGRWFFARRKPLALLAPHILHVGLLVILIGAFLSSFQSQAQLALYPGQTHELPSAIADFYGPADVTVDDFQTIYDEQGAIENWVTQFTLTPAEGPAQRGLSTQVNAPYKNKGLSIYQMAYDNRYVIELADSADVDGEYAIPENQRLPMGSSTFKIAPMTENLPLLMIYDENDELLDQVALYEGTSYEFPNGGQLTYLFPHFATILQLKFDRSLPVVFAGFLIAVLGSMALLVGRYEDLRAHESPDGTLRVRLGIKDQARRDDVMARLGMASKEGSS